MTAVYKVIAVLLTYPERDWVSRIDELHTILRNENEAVAAMVDPLVIHLVARSLIDLQETYVATFDQTGDHALYLFHHLVGDSPDRGHAMSDLVETYRRHGIEPTGTELPDFLPRYLEFLSLLPARAFRQEIERARQVVGILLDRLSRAQSPYAAAFAALNHALALRPRVPILAPIHLLRRATKRLRM